MSNVTPYSSALLGLVDEGHVDPKSMLVVVFAWMGEDQVKAMVHNSPTEMMFGKEDEASEEMTD